MPIHFSIGFVAESMPRRPVVAECGGYQDRYEAVGVVPLNYVMGIWPRMDGSYCMCGTGSCGCGGCIKRGSICAPKGDDALIIFSIYDTDGDEFDLTGASEIVFMVADEYDGEVRFVKRLTDSQIQISTNGYQFSVTVTDDDTADLIRVHNYYEVQVTTSAGLKKTVSAGNFEATNTMIRGLE